MKQRQVVFAAWLFCMFSFGPALAARAQQSSSGISVQISQETATLMAGDWVTFNTVLRNDGAMATPPLVAHLNIAAVQRGPYVDPEDWASERTRYLPALVPGETAQLEWRVHVLTAGEFAAFVTIVAPDASFVPAASQSLLLQVTPDKVLPLGELIPVVAVVPFFPLALLLWRSSVTRRERRRRS